MQALSGLAPPRRGERLAGAFVLAVMALACAIFWIGIPAGLLWGLGELTDSSTTHFVGAILGIPMAMIVFAPVLFWLNNLYLRVTGVVRRLEEDELESGWQRRVRGPLEPMLVVCFVLAGVAFLVWFFVLAENPGHIV